MGNLTYKSFSWPNNPEIYREDCVREPMYTKSEDNETVFAGMGPAKRVITGSGAFFGSDAAATFARLAEVFAAPDRGSLVHPILGTRSAYFTKLEMTQSPRADYVAYSFEFMEADAEGAVPK